MKLHFSSNYISCLFLFYVVNIMQKKLQSKNVIISISIDNEVFIACNKRILYNISSFSLNDLNLDIILEF